MKLFLSVETRYLRIMMLEAGKELLFLSLFFIEMGFLCVVPGCPGTQRYTCLGLPSAGILGVRHHTSQELFLFY